MEYQAQHAAGIVFDKKVKTVWHTMTGTKSKLISDVNIALEEQVNVSEKQISLQAWSQWGRTGRLQ